MTQVLSTTELRRHVDRLPRAPLAHLPTPLEEMANFRAWLGGPPVYIKRDDCTGLAFGGNKTRHNEFVLGDAREKQVDMFVWGAGVQSNNCRQTAAACARFNLPCRLLLSRSHFSDEVQGNLLIDHLLGAEVEIVDPPVGPELDDLLTQEAERYRAAGRNVYVWDRHIVKPLAAVSYVLCLVEIVEQLAAVGKRPQAIYVCSAGSTGVGLAVGKAALGLEAPVRSIAPIRWPWDTPADMAKIANQTAELIGLETQFESGDVEITEDFVGEDYGIATREGMEALEAVARKEAIMLDPVYTGKAMGALIHDVRSGRLAGDDPVVFVHTGGTPALFAYRDRLMEMIPPIGP